MMKQILFLFGVISMACLIGCDGQELTVNMDKTVTETNAPPTNLSKDIKQAAAENKLLLLEFGSSDSCPPCVLMQQKVFSTPEFKAYASSNLVFVRLDFPLNHDLLPDTRATNAILAQQFDANGLPTFIALDKSGKEFWRQQGVTPDQFDPKSFIDLIQSVKGKEK